MVTIAKPYPQMPVNGVYIRGNKSVLMCLSWKHILPCLRILHSTDSPIDTPTVLVQVEAAPPMPTLPLGQDCGIHVKPTRQWEM